MEEKTSVAVGSGNGLFTLFIVFLVLKLTGVITCSWWFVTMPLWGVPALIIGVSGIAIVIVLLIIICKFIYKFFSGDR